MGDAYGVVCAELDQMIDNSMMRDVDENGVWHCLLCIVANRHKARIGNHVKTYFESQQYWQIYNH